MSLAEPPCDARRGTSTLPSDNMANRGVPPLLRFASGVQVLGGGTGTGSTTDVTIVYVPLTAYEWEPITE